jgi:hypothetical protein
MNFQRLFILSILSIFLACLSITVVLGQQSSFDRAIPTESEVRASVQLATELATKHPLTATEILQIYSAEKIIGRVVWGVLGKDTVGFERPFIRPKRYFGDTTLTMQCALYVQKNLNRFRLVSDAWKGEEDFLEPNRFWFNRAIALDPNSVEATNIEFDLDFKDFIRRIDIDERAGGKTCQQYFDKLLAKNRDTDLEEFSKEQIGRWPAECDSARTNFIRSRGRLLQMYNNAPFTKILQDIDPTTVVVFHSID